jgi:hypothetical protein
VMQTCAARIETKHHWCVHQVRCYGEVSWTNGTDKETQAQVRVQVPSLPTPSAETPLGDVQHMQPLPAALEASPKTSTHPRPVRDLSVLPRHYALPRPIICSPCARPKRARPPTVKWCVLFHLFMRVFHWSDRMFHVSITSRLGHDVTTVRGEAELWWDVVLLLVRIAD